MITKTKDQDNENLRRKMQTISGTEAIHKKQEAYEKSLPALHFHLRHRLENLGCVGTV